MGIINQLVTMGAPHCYVAQKMMAKPEKQERLLCLLVGDLTTRNVGFSHKPPTYIYIHIYTSQLPDMGDPQVTMGLYTNMV
jgi:hypothetical protein